MPNGTLTLIFQAAFALAVEDAAYLVKDASDAVVARGTLSPGSGGISGTISLPAPERSTTFDPDAPAAPYSTYTVEASAAGYYNAVVRDVQIFADVHSTQTINLIPVSVPYDTRVGTRVYQIPPHALRLSYLPQQESFSGRILKEVVIPERITVHLGSPAASAQNVSVPFTDYIKNVASSEIYPTWPEASLRANILAEISLALNRIYTEWYPSQGYSYDITNSTAYDQYFVYGRNIFDPIERIVDEIFSTYIRKPGREEPFYAEYCSGTTVTCPGMSQWGTVSLAEDGFTPKQILEFYYGDVELVTTDRIEAVEESYPGSPLRPGSSGEEVIVLQNQLNRVAINFPTIPAVFADGVFGEDTAEAVRAFQRVANLSPDGVVGRATWYALSRYYTAVKKLAELKSEGEAPQYNVFDFPGILRRGSRGTGVQQLQFFLNNLAAYNPAIPSQKVDGIFGTGTERAVRAFQTAYRLPEDGVVGEETWDALIGAYRGARSVPVPVEPVVTRPYPGYLVRRGQTGENVTYLQNALNRIRTVFAQIPALKADGIFGGGTEEAVRTFQRLFGLPADGIAGPATWRRINELYLITESGCIYSSDSASYTRPYPGYLVRRGQIGENVRYVQSALGVIRRVIRTLPSLVADGIFGVGTQSAVRAFQTALGLSADGIVGPETWRRLNNLYIAVTEGCLYAG